MAAAFNDVTSGEALAEFRWNNHRPGERQPHLAAMRMASQGECNSVRDEAEDVGIVRQQENRRATVGDCRQCGGQITPTGPQVADACDPQQAGRRVEVDGCVLDDADADCFECLPHAIVVEPAVVVAENGDDFTRRGESRQLDHDLFRRNEAPTEPTLNDKVAQNTDDVRQRRIGAIDRRVELGHPVERRSNVQIGERREWQNQNESSKLMKARTVPSGRMFNFMSPLPSGTTSMARFLLMVTPLALPNATGSPVNPVAMF